jgi:uncharacterized DUF497 family protein
MAKEDHFDWDDHKAASNEAKHGITFEEAQWVFDDERATTKYDEKHSITEDRWITIGFSKQGNLLVVIHTDEPDLIRIISARRATKHETRQYKQQRS